MSIGERANLLASDSNRADGLVRTDQRDGQYGAVAKTSGMVAALRVLIAFGPQIGDMNRFPVEDGPSGDKLTRQGQRVILWDRPMVGDDAEKVAVHPKDRRVIGVAKAGSACRNICEYPLQVHQ